MTKINILKFFSSLIISSLIIIFLKKEIIIFFDNKKILDKQNEIIKIYEEDYKKIEENKNEIENIKIENEKLFFNIINYNDLFNVINNLKNIGNKNSNYITIKIINITNENFESTNSSVEILKYSLNLNGESSFEDFLNLIFEIENNNFEFEIEELELKSNIKKNVIDFNFIVSIDVVKEINNFNNMQLDFENIKDFENPFYYSYGDD